MAQILLVDDDARIRELLKQYLVKQGMQVVTAEDAQAARKLLSSFSFDLIVLDVMMPGEDGIEFAKRVREESDVPILMLTAKTSVDDRLMSFAAGADDFLAKPFDPRELMMRIDAILRRVRQEDEKNNIGRFGPFIFEVADGRLTKDGARIDLTRAERDLLRVLVENMNEELSRAELTQAISLDDENSRAVDITVTRLRKKLEDDPKHPRYIQTIRGIGYRLSSSL